MVLGLSALRLPKHLTGHLPTNEWELYVDPAETTSTTPQQDNIAPVGEAPTGPPSVGGSDAVYVSDTKSTSGAVKPNPRRPLEDGYHDQNCVGYIVLRFGPTAPTQKQTRRVEEPEWPTYMPMGENAWMA